MKMYLLVVLVLVQSLNSIECPLTERFQTRIFSGEISVVPDDIYEQMEIPITFEDSLSWVPVVGLGLKGYSGYASSFIQFSFSLSKTQKTQFTIQVKSGQKSRWRTLFIHYLFSTREDIEIGQAQTTSPVYNYQDVFYVQYETNHPIKETTSITPFISGVGVSSVDGKFIGLRYEKQQTIQKTVRFYFSSSNQNSIVNFLKLTILCFDQKVNGLLYSVGVVEEYNVEKGALSTIDRNNIQSLSGHMVGITAFQISISAPSSMMSAITDTFSLKFGPKNDGVIEYLSVSYVVLEQVECGNCDEYSYLYRGTCRKQCPSFTFPAAGRCLLNLCNGLCLPQCQQNEHYESGYCVCDDDYNRIEGKCQKCPDYTIYNYNKNKCQSICGDNAEYNATDERCYCDEGFYVLRDQIKYCGKCNPQQEYDWENFKCIGECQQNQRKVDGRCQCKPNYQKVKGQCIKCPSDSQYSLLFGTCVCEGAEYNSALNLCVKSKTCNQNQIQSFGECKCQAGSFRINGRCQFCPDNSEFDKSTGFCECKRGYRLQNGKCILINRCTKKNQIRAPDGRCICKDGYARNRDNDCMKVIINCPSKQIKVNDKCVCKIGYERSGNGDCVAIECESDEVFSYTEGKCVRRCPFGEEYSEVFGKCVKECPKNQEWNGRQCVCKDGYEKNVYNQCIKKCGVGQVRASNGLCTCDLGYKVHLGFCQPAHCGGSGQIYDPRVNRCVRFCKKDKEVYSNGKCQCMSGYEYNQYGNCEKSCPPGERRQFGICKCLPNYIRISGVCRVNPCLSSQIWQNGKCVPQCPPNSYWAGFGCACNPGYRRNNHNQCVKVCPQNQVVNNNNECQCKPYFFRQNQKCVPIVCNEGYRYDLALKRCLPICTSAFEKWQNQKCVCIDGYERYGSACVAKCRENEQRRNGNCVCRFGYIRDYRGICVSQFCQVGQVRSSNGQCVDICTKDNQVWDTVNRRCKCKTGYVRNQQQNCAIFQCPAGQTKNNLGICVDICRRNNEIFNNSRCQCDTNFVRDGFGNCVRTCPSGQRTNSAGNCVEICPLPGQQWKSTVGRCVCLDTYYRNNSGVCVRRCIKAYELWDNTTSACMCKDGFVRNTNTGFCELDDCKINERKVNGRCLCQEGFQNISGLCQPTSPLACKHGTVYDSSRQLCVCAVPYIWIYGRCRINPNCPAFSYFNGDKCECLYGYVQTNGKCQQFDKDYECPANSSYNGISCFCDPGFHAVNGACVRCPSGTTWNGAFCSSSSACINGFIYDDYLLKCVPKSDCGPNQYLDGVNCRCRVGYHWINEECVKCGEGSTFDGRQCVQNHLVRNVCGPYQYYLPGGCVCMPGFLPTKHFCIVCPEFTFWNGCQCQFLVTFSQADDPEALILEERMEITQTIPAKIVKK